MSDNDDESGLTSSEDESERFWAPIRKGNVHDSRRMPRPEVRSNDQHKEGGGTGGGVSG